MRRGCSPRRPRRCWSRWRGRRAPTERRCCNSSPRRSGASITRPGSRPATAATSRRASSRASTARIARRCAPRSPVLTTATLPSAPPPTSNWRRSWRAAMPARMPTYARGCRTARQSRATCPRSPTWKRRPPPTANATEGAREGRGAARGRGADGLEGEPAALTDVASDDPDVRLAGYRGLLRFVQRAARSPTTKPDDVVARVRLLALLQSEARYDVSRMKSAPDGLRDALLFPDRDAPIDQQRYVSGHEDLIRVPVETRVSGRPSIAATNETCAVRRPRLRRRTPRSEQNEQDGPDAATVIRSEGRKYDDRFRAAGSTSSPLSRGSPAASGRRARRSRSSVSRARCTTSESAITVASAFRAIPRWSSGEA